MLETTVDRRGVATLVLARPDRHNALDAALIDALHGAALRLAADPAVRVVVVTGRGESFCAGADLAWMQAQTGAAPAARAAEARRLSGMLAALDALPKPLIARVNGAAYGGGLGLIACADVAIAAEGARFGLTEVRLGLIPATIAPFLVARMGAAAARRVALSGRRFDAAEARALGLLAAMVPAAELDAAVAAEAAAHLAAAPGAVAEVKALLRALAPTAGPAAREMAEAALVRRWDSAEAAEGIAGFFARRPPPWAAD